MQETRERTLTTIRVQLRVAVLVLAATGRQRIRPVVAAVQTATVKLQRSIINNNKEIRISLLLAAAGPLIPLLLPFYYIC